MSRRSFDRLVARLEQNDIFKSTGHKPQMAVRYQLGCFLIRYGMLGGDALTAASLVGVGHGTALKFCE